MLAGKIKWNIKHIVLDDTKWTWLNEMPHYINYVGPLYWGKAEAHTQRKRPNPKILVCCPVCRAQLIEGGHTDRLKYCVCFRWLIEIALEKGKSNQKGKLWEMFLYGNIWEYNAFLLHATQTNVFHHPVFIFLWQLQFAFSLLAIRIAAFVHFCNRDLFQLTAHL